MLKNISTTSSTDSLFIRMPGILQHRRQCLRRMFPDEYQTFHEKYEEEIIEFFLQWLGIDSDDKNRVVPFYEKIKNTLSPVQQKHLDNLINAMNCDKALKIGISHPSEEDLLYSQMMKMGRFLVENGESNDVRGYVKALQCGF